MKDCAIRLEDALQNAGVTMDVPKIRDKSGSLKVNRR